MSEHGYTGAEAERDGMNVAPGMVSAMVLEVWQTGTEEAVYRLLAIEVAPRLLSHLARAYRMQEADCQDCLSTAYDRFAPAVRSRKVLTNPYGYFFKIGINAALELLREQQAELIDPGRDANCIGDSDVNETVWADLSDLPPDMAVEIVEDAVSEIEVEDFWAVEVVRLAVERLSPGLRQVAQSLMHKDLAFEGGGAADFEYSARDTAAELGMKPGAFRTAKHRAYAAVRDMVPALIIELGITPPERAEAAIFPEGRGHFLSDNSSM